METEIGALLTLGDAYFQQERFVFDVDVDVETWLEATGALLAVNEQGDDYDEVWVTNWRIPWELSAVYERVF